MEPKITQHGSHMVMTNVVKETKKKYINIDTKFRDDYNTNSVANYTITLPQRITEAKTMTIKGVEIPNTIYNISANMGNNGFTVKDKSTNTTRTIVVPDDNYTSSSLISLINTKLSNYSIGLSLSLTNNNMVFTSTSVHDLSLGFAVDASGNFDKHLLTSKLGWALGFRSIDYSVSNGGTITAEALPDLTGSRYVYLAIDEFVKGNQYSFVSPLPYSLINKNIIARIAIDKSVYSFGQIIHANANFGSLISDVRSYTGKVDLQRLTIQLLDEWGRPVQLNGLDFSFCMEIQHE